MSSRPVPAQEVVNLGEDFELNLRRRELRRGDRLLKIERIPMELLLLLVERRNEVVTRDQIVERVWGKGVFLDTDNSINGAIRKLRQALRDNPEQPRFVQTITGTGYRFIADVDELPAGPQLVTPPQPAANRPHHARIRRFTLIGVATVLALTAVAAYLQGARQHPRVQPSAGKLMLAVLPFENLTGDASQDYFSDGLVEELITQLGRLDPQRFGVIARTSIMRYKGTRQPLDRVGRELGVEYVLEGSVRRDADKVRITAQLIQVRDQTNLWAGEYDRQLSHLLILQSEIAEQVAGEIRVALGAERRAVAVHPPVLSQREYEAYDLYLKGRYFWNKRTAKGLLQGADYFRQAVAKDPDYARAYAGLADSYAMMGSYYQGPQNDLMPQARAAALRALQIDDGLAEAHTSLALISENFDWDWKTAEKEYRRAIELDPNYATAHHWYAEFLAFQGRFDEALAESESARRLDPLSLIIAADHAAILYFARQPDRSIEEARGIVDMDPTISRAHGIFVSACANTGRYSEALADLDNWKGSDQRWAQAMRAYVYAREGQSQRARATLSQLQASESRRFELPPMLAPPYAVLDDKNAAMGWLEEGYAQHSSLLTTLKVDPAFDPLRKDPRFQDLLRRVGLTR